MKAKIFVCKHGYGMSKYYLEHPEKIPGYKELINYDMSIL